MRERTVSTMDDARDLARTGCPPGTVVVAGFQEKGRGRLPGRAWVSPPWESLLATVVLSARELRFPLPQLPLRAALAVSLAIEDAAGIPVRVRWPNDILFSGKKVAGILCEARGDTVLVGLGVNCAQREFPPGIAAGACSLLMASGRGPQVFALLSAVLGRLKEALDDGGWRERLLARLASMGAPARVDPLGSGESVEGIVRGIDADGALVLERGDGAMQRVRQGEIRAER